MNGERETHGSGIPVLDLSWSQDAVKKPLLLKQLRSALFDIGFLYVINHGVEESTISALVQRLPPLFQLPTKSKAALSKLNSPHFLGYSGFAEETTLGKQDLREQFDFATELHSAAAQTLHQGQSDGKASGADRSDRSNEPKTDRLYQSLRGPNQWPSEDLLPGFREAFTRYHDAVEQLSYRFVHLIEEAFKIPVGTFDAFFDSPDTNDVSNTTSTWQKPQHRIKLVKYPPSPDDAQGSLQGCGAHKDSSGWLTFLYQVGEEEGLEVLGPDGDWIKASPIKNSFVVNFGNAFEAATEGAVKATTHRVIAPGPKHNTRYSIPFFQGLPLDMTVSQIRGYIPADVRSMRKRVNGDDAVSTFLDPRWDSLGESQLRKWIRSHKDVGLKWYGKEVVDFYTTA